jgi:hypothetical protein
MGKRRCKKFPAFSGLMETSLNVAMGLTEAGHNFSIARSHG